MKGDERLKKSLDCLSLYPTWFRWKWKTMFSATAPLVFISHMVQMKVTERRELKQQPLSPLYPTWFRWKYTVKKTLFMFCYSLYPTWFRWKSVSIIATLPPMPSLYPTWFRWKVMELVLFLLAGLSLYPTWFRWKTVKKGKNDEKISLYIPHGSDESPSCSLIENSSSLFISHMVQMKADVRDKGCPSIKTLYPTWFRWKWSYIRRTKGVFYALYPTWFRWKTNPSRPGFPLKKYFISHMVQMKVRFLSFCIHFMHTLYPTWFRWKIIIKINNNKGGSYFISHMVQMKAANSNLQAIAVATFISHMVQMKVKHPQVLQV